VTILNALWTLFPLCRSIRVLLQSWQRQSRDHLKMSLPAQVKFSELRTQSARANLSGIVTDGWGALILKFTPRRSRCLLTRLGLRLIACLIVMVRSNSSLVAVPSGAERWQPHPCSHTPPLAEQERIIWRIECVFPYA
jgi:hypothetical protein